MEHKILRTYDKTWNFERKLYAIDDIRLPFPINLDEMVYLVAGFAFMYIVCRVIPLLSAIPFVLRYLFMPWALMKFLTKKKFDGKLAHYFILGYIDYLGLPKKICRFREVKPYKKGKCSGVVYRQEMMVDRTRLELTKREGVKKHV